MIISGRIAPIRIISGRKLRKFRDLCTVASVKIRDIYSSSTNFSVRTSEYKSDPPIMIAIDCGYKDITKLLLEHKQLDINEKASNGHTPLSK